MSGALASLVLAGARTWACLRLQVAWRRAIGPSWEWIAAALAVVIASLALVGGQLELAPEAPSFAIALGLELLLGSTLGLAISLPGWALIGAMDTSEQLLDLHAEEAGGSLARLLIAASLAAGLGLGLHAPLCAGLLGLFDRFVLAAPHTWLPTLAALPAWLVDRCASITLLALALATPVLLTRTVITLALAPLARGAPSCATLLDATLPTLRTAAALLALGAAWSTFPEAFAQAM